MKKFISILLVLVLCMGVFAGCADTTNDGLEAAQKLLFTQYNTAGKDQENKIISNTELTNTIIVDGETYEVTWKLEITSGAADGVVLTDSETPNFTTLKLVDQSEELHYVLTGTVKAPNGDTADVVLKCYSPKVEKQEIPTGKIFLYNPETKTYVTAVEFEYTSSSGSKKWELEMSADSAKAMSLTVRENADKSVTFITEDGKYLYADATDVKLATEESENTKFVMEAAEGGSFLKCFAATYNNNAQYLEAYSNSLTVYGFSESKSGIYTFSMVEAKVCDHESVEVAAKDATCTEAGNTAGHVCSKCGITLDGNETIKVLGHDWDDGVIITEATADQAGKKKYTCQREGCGITEERAYEFVLTEWVAVSAPEVGKAYKLGMYQGKLDANYYITGVKGGYNNLYYATTTTAKEAADVYLEAVEGGYNMYCMVDGAKLYLNMVVSGAYVNGKFEATASTVYTIKDGVLVANISGVSDSAKDGEYAFGTRNDEDNDTIGPVMTKYNGFHCALYIEQEVKTGEEVIADGDYSIMVDGVYADKVGASLSYGYLVNSNVAVKFTIKNVKGGITIQDDLGRYLTSTSYGTFTVTAEAPADGSHIWTIVKNDDGSYTISNNVTGKIIAHSTNFNSCGVYAEDKLTDDHNKNLTISAWDENAGPVIPTEDGKVTLYFTLKSDSVEIPAWACPYISGGVWGWADWCAKGSETFKHLEGTDIWYLITDKVKESGTYKIFLNYSVMQNHAWKNVSTNSNPKDNDGNCSFTHVAGEQLIDLGEHGWTEINLPDPTTMNYVLVGGFNSWSNDAGIALTATATAGIYESDYMDVAANTEFKITNGNWANAGGIEIANNGGNFKVETAGKYKVRFDLNKGEVTLVEYKEPATPGEQQTVSATISDIASANSWADKEHYLKFNMNDDITVTAAGTAVGSYSLNTGYYASSSGQWRIYQSENATVTISAAEGKTIVSVKITYNGEKGGVLTNGDVQIASDDVVVVNANSITLGVGNSGTATNGQARITAIEVIYA